jgi:hypothetical protein
MQKLRVESLGVKRRYHAGPSPSKNTTWFDLYLELF